MNFLSGVLIFFTKGMAMMREIYLKITTYFIYVCFNSYSNNLDT